MANALPQKKGQRSEAHALLGAAGDGDAAAVARLLAAGAGADVRLARGGETPLMRAAACGHAEVARVLLDAGADPSARRADGFTPLILAVFFGHEDIARLLVGRGADVRARTNLGTTATRWAASRGFAEMADLLRGAENATPHTPVPAASATTAGVKAPTPPSDGVSIFSRKGERRGTPAAVTFARASAREANALADDPAENSSRPHIFPPDVAAPNVSASNDAPPELSPPGGPAAGVSVRLGGQLPAHPSASAFRLGPFLRSWQGSVGVALLLLAFGVAVFALLRGGTAARESATTTAATPPPAAPQTAAQAPAPPLTEPSPAFPTPEAQSVLPASDPAYALPSAPGYPFYVTPVAPVPGQAEAPRGLAVVTENGVTSNEEATRTRRKPEANANEPAPAQGEVRSTHGADADARTARDARPPEPEQRPAPPALTSTPPPAPQPTPGRPKVIQWPPQ